MEKTDSNQITTTNREVIERIVRDNGLTEGQRVELEKFSRLDDEWRMQAAVGNRYPGNESKLEEVSELRASILRDETDPVLGKAIKDYERQVDEAVFENES